MELKSFYAIRDVDYMQTVDQKFFVNNILKKLDKSCEALILSILFYRVIYTGRYAKAFCWLSGGK
jgi:hypothetical protein